MHSQQSYHSRQRKRRQSLKETGSGRFNIKRFKKDRLRRLIMIGVYTCIIPVLFIPNYLVLMELSGSLIRENRILGIISLVTGMLLCLFLLGRMLNFTRQRLSYERKFSFTVLIFTATILCGQLLTDRTVGLTDLLERYKRKFIYNLEYFKAYTPSPSREFEEQIKLSYSHVDSVALNIKDHKTLQLFADYARGKYYNDMVSRAVYFEICEMMSTYQVFLEEFRISGMGKLNENQMDIDRILEHREATHTEITILFTACLMYLRYPVIINQNNPNRLCLLVKLTTSEYFDLDNFLVHEWEYGTLSWYMHEFIYDSSESHTHILPFYIPTNPIHTLDPKSKQNFLEDNLL